MAVGLDTYLLRDQGLLEEGEIWIRSPNGAVTPLSSRITGNPRSNDTDWTTPVLCWVNETGPPAPFGGHGDLIGPSRLWYTGIVLPIPLDADGAGSAGPHLQRAHAATGRVAHYDGGLAGSRFQSKADRYDGTPAAQGHDVAFDGGLLTHQGNDLTILKPLILQSQLIEAIVNADGLLERGKLSQLRDEIGVSCGLSGS